MSLPGAMILVFLAALAVRIFYVYALRESPFFHGLIVDAQWHDTWARDWAAGQWSADGRAFFRAPLYPFFLSVIYRIFGHDLLAARIVQAVVGASTAAALAGCGWRAGGKKAALWAGGIAALYGPFIFFDAEILIPNLLLGLLAWSMFFFLSLPSWRTCFIGALLLGLATIARPTALVFLPVVVVYLWNRLRSEPRLQKLLVAVVFVITLAPGLLVTVFNAVEENTFVYIASQGGVNFYAGNHEQATGKTVEIPEFQQEQVAWADFVATSYRVPEEALGRPVSSREASNFWAKKGRDFITSRPAAALALTLKKIYYVLNAYEIPNNRDLYFDRKGPLQVLLWKLPVFAFPWGLLFPLALMGAILGLGIPEKRAVTAFLIGWIVLYIIFVVPFFVSSRFRLGMVPAMILLASIAITEWKSRRGTGPLIAVLVALVFVNTGFLQARIENPAQEYAKRGVAAFGTGQLMDARHDLEAAVEANPQSPKYVYFLGQVYMAQGNTREANRLFQRSLDLGATNQTILVNMGRDLLDLQDYPAAVIALARAVANQPDDAAVHSDLGKAYEFTDQLEKAGVLYQRAIELDPRLPGGHLGLGFVYQKQGLLNNAIDTWRTGTQIIPGSYALQYNLALGYAQAAQYGMARRVVEFAMRIKPDAPEAAALRDWLDQKIAEEKQNQ